MIAGWDAISDLPVVNQGEGYDGMPYTGEATNDYQQHMRKGSDSLYNHIANVMRPVQTARLASIGPGQGLKDMPPELQAHTEGLITLPLRLLLHAGYSILVQDDLPIPKKSVD